MKIIKMVKKGILEIKLAHQIIIHSYPSIGM